MIASETIYIKNIYYMLSYAFSVLNDKSYRKIETESFENVSELLSEILAIGVARQIKQGLVKDYIEISETTSSIKGKINITESINEQSFIKGQLNCSYDEFSVNCYLNRILKSTMNLLIKSDISHARKKKLKGLLMYFGEVDLIDVGKINWKIRFDRNNQSYKMLINICYLAVKGLIHTEKSGEVKLMEFLDDSQMSRLYEKFVLNYYKKEHPELLAHAPQINWQIDDGADFLLPKMQTDVTLEYENRILIIDTKFYKSNLSKNYGKNIHNTSNLYQIFTYVKNKEVELQGNDIEISGMLLYARTNQRIQPDSDYVMSGNKISVKTLDLNQDFEIIKSQLDGIVDEYCKIKK
ncbi:MAG: 5-methylcytosine-specific restriction endonuclease system specificity protein McrC [Methanobrevibacter sp.]|uniref:5-methylcytosine-specific restriction endonuclease system specificity protein McrC n=1 Tax=Methanobrevibacter sp. TaxID=66852 RepID=UPI0025E36C43|nr:5-methylcytosine-specific restriction endonuclease system specificity protein McrC [Methanobrevibacter sp.]MBR0270828.1 5-methylcytosine-specific restriction endonuclease system specificity protein McrC [Methanobrevibacter sp.]